MRFARRLSGDLDPKWTDVWSHIYIGKIWDLLGQRARAVNEYSLAQHTGDDTAGAQAGSYAFSAEALLSRCGGECGEYTFALR